MKGLLPFTAAMLVLCSCQSDSETEFLEVRGLETNKKYTFVVTDMEAGSLSDIDILIRHENTEDEQEFTLNVMTMAPDSSISIEPVRIKLDRKHLPASVKPTQTVPYRHNIALTQRGLYTFSLIPDRNVKGIEAIGIKKSKNGKR